MYKKYIVGISTILLFAVLLFLNGLQNDTMALFTHGSSENAEEILTEKERVDCFDFHNLLCNGIQVPVDSLEKTFYVPLDMESDKWENLEFASGDPEYRICFTENFTQSDKKELIASGKGIEFLVYNDTEFSTYHIVFTGLPIIDIFTTDGLEGQQNIGGQAVFYDINFASEGVLDSLFDGHVRGNTSTLYPKKGYKINLTKQILAGAMVKNKLSLFGMREDDDWILYALYNDETKLRAKLAVDLWDEFGSKEIAANGTYNTSMTYVELIVDEAYYGLYALMEPIDAKQLNLDVDDYLYKREQGAELTEGAFLQIEEGELTALGFELKSGEMDKDAWIPMADFSAVLNSSDEAFMDNIGKIADIDNAMRLWLYIQVIAGVDQGSKNVFYVARNVDDSYQFTFAPWDLDLTFGNTSASEAPHYTKFTKDRLKTVIRWQPGTRMMELNVDESVKEMQRLYRELRNSELSDTELEARMEALDHTIRDSGAYEREQERWPEAASADDYSQVSEYVKERLAYLDTALFDLEMFFNN